MKILSAQQIREADKFTIENEPVSSINLMERAATACVKRITEFTHRNSFYSIFCGKGNNGGDGLTIARLLAEMGRKVEVFIINHSEKQSEDFTTNLKRLGSSSVKITTINSHAELVSASHEALKQVQVDGGGVFIIDALLGTGINKPVEGLLAETIDFINVSGLPVISIDVPSGLFCDEKPNHKHIIRATKTLTFQRPKLTFLFAEFYQYTGNFEILDVGLNENFIEKQNGSNFYLTHHDIALLINHRSQISHKGSFGHALLLAGSKGKIGAAVLASRACLRSGAGLLTTHLPACGYQILQTALPEAMVSADENENCISACPKTDKYAAIAVGPGIDDDKSTVQALKVLLQQASVPLVLDADAINILSHNKTWLSFVPPNTIITPHPKEFDRLVGAHTSDFDRLESCKEFARKNNIVVVLKSAHTAIVFPDKKVFFNSSGNAALAKGGSGDVLTGIILGLLSRGYSPEHACLIAVYVHGHAADLYIKKFSDETMLATDLIELLPLAFNL
jgi:ADP-dependent NAD(P)H-hydrate dehydratase / NAD(P)H-hydrate epimerase